MQKLKNLSLFKISILLVINLLLKNNIVLLFTLIYLLLVNNKELLLFIVILLLINLTNSYKNDFIKLGIVEDINDSYAIVDKLLYKDKVYTDKNLNVGDILLFNEESEKLDESNLVYNYRFSYKKDVKTVGNIKIRKIVNNRINSFNSETSLYLKKILINDSSNDSELEYIGYGFSFYYLLLMLSIKNKKMTFTILFFYIIMFKFDIKFYLIIIDLLAYYFNLNRINRLSIKIIFTMLININMIRNYSIRISLLFSLYYMSELRDDSSYIAIIQSLFFNEVHLLTSFLYRYIVYFRIFLFALCFITLIFKPFSIILITIIKFYSFVLKTFDISIKGRINLFLLLFLFIFINTLKINNKYIKTIIICLLIISPLNNPIMHLSFIDVGQGDSILLHGPLNKYNILIDTGSIYNYQKLKRELNKEGIYQIDYLIITHNDSDHSGNIDNLIKDYDVREIVESGKDIENKSICLKYLYLGNFDNDNDNSLVYLLNIDNYKVLLTGDISSKVENSIINKFNIKNIDILKVSHHGSKTASSRYFISNLLPRFAIISTSGAYNHPNKEVIDILNKFLVDTYITKDSKTISFYFTHLIDFIKTGNMQFVII